MGPRAAEASLKSLQGNILPRNEGAEPGVDWAFASAAGACLAKVAVQRGGDVVEVVYQGAFVARGPLAGDPEEQRPYEAERQEAPVGAE